MRREPVICVTYKYKAMKTKTLCFIAFLTVQVLSISIVNAQKSSEKLPMGAIVNNLQIGDITKEELLFAGQISLIESYKDDFSILSFRLTIISADKKPVQLTNSENGNFTDEMISAIKTSSSDDKIYFEFIKCKSREGDARYMGSLVFTLK